MSPGMRGMRLKCGGSLQGGADQNTGLFLNTPPLGNSTLGKLRHTYHILGGPGYLLLTCYLLNTCT